MLGSNSTDDPDDLNLSDQSNIPKQPSNESSNNFFFNDDENILCNFPQEDWNDFEYPFDIEIYHLDDSFDSPIQSPNFLAPDTQPDTPQNKNCKNKRKRSYMNDYLCGRPIRSPKTKINLSKSAKHFKTFFYGIFTKKSKFPKKFVKTIHSKIFASLEIEDMNRDEFRQIDLYFKKFSKYSTKIIKHIQMRKNELLESIPGFSQAI